MRDLGKGKNKYIKREKFDFWKFTKYLIVVFNFIGSLSSIVGLVYTISGTSISKLSVWVWIIAVIIFVCAFSASVLFLLSEKYDSWRECVKYASGLHKILHCLRDMNVLLHREIDNNTQMTKKQFSDKMTSQCIEVMTMLSNILSDALQCKVRSCVKLIDFCKEGEVDADKIQLITFARSGLGITDKVLREQKNSISVEQNTDFKYIFKINEEYEENSEHFFYQKDLRKYDEQLKRESNGQERYENSDKTWRKKYNTTIVMPIRHLEAITDNEATYDIRGFLCVDSKKAGSFENKNFNFTIELLKGISDIMYSYFNDWILYYNQMND